jgi:hypothetical protein
MLPKAQSIEQHTDPSKERFGDLPSRLKEAWRVYQNNEDRFSLTKDIELIDAMNQIIQDRFTALHEMKFTDWKSENALIDKLTELTLVRAKLVETDDKRSAKAKQFYTQMEVMIVFSAFVMAINEESNEVRERIKTRLAGSPVADLHENTRRGG